MRNSTLAHLMPGFRTTRLWVQHWHFTLNTDADELALSKALVPVLTPAVLKHLPPSMQVEQKSEEILNWMNARAAESDVYSIFHQQTEALVGLLILDKEQQSDPMQKVHLGYLLAEHEWGKGYASELINGLLLALQKKAPIRLIGGVAVDNFASAHVLKKAGFSLDSSQSDDETEVYSVAIDKASAP